MQRKPGFPMASCNIKMPDHVPGPEAPSNEDDGDQNQRRQQLINFGHVQWGFNNWSWSVSKQEVDFVDFSNGKYVVGVAAYVSITVKSLDIHRENIGYATCIASMKGSAIYQARKCAVTNALRETLLSFGGNVATELMEMLETHKTDTHNPVTAHPPENLPENNQNLLNKPSEPKNSPLSKNMRKDSSDSSSSVANLRAPPLVQPVLKNAVVANPPPVAKAHPMPANLPPAANRPTLQANAPRPPAPVPPHVRPNSNEPVIPPESSNEEEARAERLRRQRLAQEEFRLKQLSKQKNDCKQDLHKSSSSFDNLLMDIPTQDIVIEESGIPESTEGGKRKFSTETGAAKRHSSGISKLDIYKYDK